jgi:hypothetical protein
MAQIPALTEGSGRRTGDPVNTRAVTLVLVAVAGVGTGAALARPTGQKYAPLVGEWRLVATIDQTEWAMAFHTDGEGVAGRGTGMFVLPAGDGEPRREFPGVWENRDPNHLGLCGEVTLGRGVGPALSGTLVIRARLQAGRPVDGDALIVDHRLVLHRGRVTMRQTAGPEQMRRR